MCRAGSAPCSAAACDEAAARCRTLGVDFDGDGYPEGADCDDENASRFPYNPERCDAIDNDCDPETLGPDADGDGVVATACCNQQPNGAAPVCGTDCNDAAPAVKPSAMEICNGVDEDCDGVIDDGVQTTYTVDADGDGYGSNAPEAMTTLGCVPALGYAPTADDCNDTPGVGRGINPSGVEVCDPTMRDENCDGAVNEGCGCPSVGSSQPCCGTRGTQTCQMTAEGSIWSECSVLMAEEICNGIDDDCDTIRDEEPPTGSLCEVTGQVCTGATCQCPVGQQACGGTCQPYAEACTVGIGACMRIGANTICDGGTFVCNVSPGTPHGGPCNGSDDNCSGEPSDDAANAPIYYRDCDGDTFGAGPAIRACVRGSSCNGNLDSTTSTDCQDGLPLPAVGGVPHPESIYPTRTDLCDGVDNNCDGTLDSVCTYNVSTRSCGRTCPTTQWTSGPLSWTGQQRCTAGMNTNACGFASACTTTAPLPELIENWTLDTIGVRANPSVACSPTLINFSVPSPGVLVMGSDYRWDGTGLGGACNLFGLSRVYYGVYRFLPPGRYRMAVSYSKEAGGRFQASLRNANLSCCTDIPDTEVEDRSDAAVPGAIRVREFDIVNPDGCSQVELQINYQSLTAPSSGVGNSVAFYGVSITRIGDLQL
ncbi:MAG: putative metal-binding motif-containing protein [Sandaracinaceae bacterium]|nr:putative metal-binding motif-containing protein [Sandaracinaceae bacterium]